MAGLTMEQLQKMGAVPVAQTGVGFTLEQLQQQSIDPKEELYKKSAEINKPWFKAKPTDTSLMAGAKAAGNIIPSAYQLGKGIVSAVTSPVQTAKSVWNIAEGTGIYLGEKANEMLGRQSNISPEYTKKKDIAKEVGNALLDRYGSLDALSATATNDPFGFATDILGLVAGGEGLLAKVGIVSKVRTGEAISKVAQEATNIAKDTKNIAAEGARAISSTNTPAEALGQVLQGTPADIPKGKAALGAIEIKGIKKFSELGSKIDEKIKTLSSEVDTDLLKDKTIKRLDELKTELKTKAGNIVTDNYVEKALNHLDELYGKIGDIAKQADIKDLIVRAKNKGLTSYDINNIAREYGIEFGSKAFSKMGDALTSVNAQLYEKVRSGLKDVARSGISGKVAKEKDLLISNLYNTKRLIQKNIDAVAKLTQKAEKMGLGRQAIRAISKAADVFTLGGFRALRELFIQSNIGRKTMNWLDIEKALEKNLKIIEKAGDKIDSGWKPSSKTFNLLKGKGGLSIQDVSKKGSPTVGKTVVSKESPLIQEARKYKSAEEFVKAQTNAFHGTSYGEFDKFDIAKRGTGADETLGYGDYGNGFYFTKNKADAIGYSKAGSGNNPTVMNVSLRNKKPFDMEKAGNVDREMMKIAKEKGTNLVGLTDKDIANAYKRAGVSEKEYDLYRELSTSMDDNWGDWDIAEKLKNEGYDSLIAPNGEITIFDAENILTKSQLTDIWNKSQPLQEGVKKISVADRLKKIKHEELGTMSDFTDFVDGTYKLTAQEAKQLLGEVTSIAKRHGIKIPKTKESLANAFDKILEKLKYKK